MKKNKTVKKIRYIDYACNVNERVKWETITGQRFEGVIIRWEEDNSLAIVKLDNGSEMSVVC